MLTIQTLSQRLAAVCGVLLLVMVLFAGHCESGHGIVVQTQNLYVTEYGAMAGVASHGQSARPATADLGAATPGVLLFPLTASGNVAPTAAITGTSTALDFPTGSAFDASGNIYVTNLSNNSVTVYAAGASGDIAPISTISGANTLLNSPEGVVLDSKGNIYVANFGPGGASSGSVTIFSAGANGDVAPLSTITGSNTNFGSPFGIALDAEGKIYVTNVNGVGVTVYPAGTNGNVAPTTTISLKSAAGIALDASNNIYVAASPGGGAAASVIVYPAGATSSTAPIATISGSNTTLINPTGIAVAANGDIYVADLVVNGVLVFAAGANGNIAPIATISGSNTQFIGARGVTVH